MRAEPGARPARHYFERATTGACDPQTKAGLRDRALPVLAFAGAFRRSELVAPSWSPSTWPTSSRFPMGLRILDRSSKTDQEAAGKRKPLPYGSDPATCPVGTLAAWLSAAEVRRVRCSGPSTATTRFSPVCLAISRWL
jgi:hypothetical protein